MAEEVEYQQALRTVGGFLDDQGGTFMSLVETDGGFALRYRDASGNPALREFSAEELRALTEEMRARRAPEGRQLQAVPREESESYGDWLRALGWELDQTGAYSIVCDDLNGSMLVTYLHLDPRLGHAVEKRLAVLSPVDKISILREARARRQKQ